MPDDHPGAGAFAVNILCRIILIFYNNVATDKFRDPHRLSFSPRLEKSWKVPAVPRR
jgi:hypothetical protein